MQLVNGGKTLRLANYQGGTVSFSNWASSYGLTGANAAFNADPNKNGLSNLLEYALGLDPSATGGGFGTTLGTFIDNGVEYLSLSYTRPTGANARPDIIYAPKRSTSVTTPNWSSSAVDAVAVGITPGPGSLETVTARFTHPLSSAAKEFLRLTVSTIP